MSGAAAGARAGLLVARLDRLPATRTVWLIVGVLGLGFFFELYDLLYTAYVVPGLVRERMLTLTPTGWFGGGSVSGFIAALFAGLFVGTLGCGFVADRWGRRPVFIASLLWYSVADLVMACQHTAAGLDAWRFVAGIGIGTELVTIGTILSELAPRAVRGRAFACCQAVGFAAVPVAALLAFLLVPRAPFGIAGWRFVAGIGAAGALAAWWMRRRLPESPRWLVAHGRVAEAEAIVAALEARVAREWGGALPEPEAFGSHEPEAFGPREPGAPIPAAAHGRFGEIWVPPLRRRTIMLVSFNVFQAVGFYGFNGWVPTLLIHRGIGVTNSLLYTFVIALAAPCGPLLGFVLADRVERRTVIVLAALAVVACGLGLGRAASAVAILPLGIGLTLANNVLSFCFHAYQQELFPTALRARAAGFVYSWSRLSAIGSAFGVGAVLERFGAGGVFATIAAAMLAAAAVVGVLGPRTAGMALERVSR